MTEAPEEERPNLQQESCSVSDGCIQHRNGIIRRQLETKEVREIFELGQRLGIQCQHNDEEVISRLAALEARDEINSRGRKEIAKLVRKERPDFLFIQETKLEEVDVALCKTLWNSDDFDWVMGKSVGSSGGLLSIWNKRNFVKQRVIEGNGFIGISGEWGTQHIKCNFVNVYAPCDRQRKASLWEEIGGLILEEGGRWLVAGDFNTVWNVTERKGRLGETQDMEDFNHFVEGTGLFDVRLWNRKFTWYRPDGTSMSRLDRFLLSTEMSLLDRDWIQVGVRRSISDHCAIILTSRNVDWGPKPFRVLDAWQQHPDFQEFVENRWKAMQIEDSI
ncbi:hypothetical protein SLEP1_g37735 [Rubroshorea leprosula]|uniref:Endonuclease/exonuclease/phosphatase domain-containing protein n=1 Tax=Rubroshorea leprosula TaxID=152421 RepID=A0AAV5KVL1_9ROSI|nr:hypothetical protein SLEP1_g37735 [Rubroshorea leprosula]